MGAFNYSTYAHAIEIGLHNRHMTPIAVLLLTCIIQYPSVKNRWGNPYKISRTEARDWYHGSASIPDGIKKGADNTKVVNNAEKYFEDNVIPEIYSDKEQDVLDAVYKAICDDLTVQKTKRKRFKNLYEAGRSAAFLSESFLYVGGTLLDEMVVTAQTRQNLRSGGR